MAAACWDRERRRGGKIAVSLAGGSCDERSRARTPSVKYSFLRRVDYSFFCRGIEETADLRRNLLPHNRDGIKFFVFAPLLLLCRPHRLGVVFPPPRRTE